MLNIALIKILNPRNFLFLGFCFLTFVLFWFLNLSDSVDDIKPLMALSHKIYYLWILGILATQISSGIWSVQLANGYSRKNLFLENVFILLLTSTAFYMFIVGLMFSFVLQNANYLPQIIDLLGFELLSFLCVGSISLFLITFIKRFLVALVTGFLLYDFEPLLGKLISFINTDLQLLLPHTASKSLLVDLNLNTESFGLPLLATLFFTLVFLRFSFLRIQSVDIKL